MTQEQWDKMLDRIKELVDSSKSELTSLAVSAAGITTNSRNEDRQVMRTWSKGDMIRVIIEEEFSHKRE